MERTPINIDSKALAVGYSPWLYPVTSDNLVSFRTSSHRRQYETYLIDYGRRVAPGATPAQRRISVNATPTSEMTSA